MIIHESGHAAPWPLARPKAAGLLYSDPGQSEDTKEIQIDPCSVTEFAGHPRPWPRRCWRARAHSAAPRPAGGAPGLPGAPRYPVHHAGWLCGAVSQRDSRQRPPRRPSRTHKSGGHAHCSSWSRAAAARTAHSELLSTWLAARLAFGIRTNARSSWLVR